MNMFAKSKMSLPDVHQVASGMDVKTDIKGCGKGGKRLVIETLLIL